VGAGRVKLRGVNVFPEAIGAIVSTNVHCNGEYVCVLEGAADRQEDMTVLVETQDESVPKDALENQLAARLKEALGVKVKVKTVGAGELDHLTGLSTTSKVKRLIDKRENIST
jgi:phenylacetate-CoA ligase